MTTSSKQSSSGPNGQEVTYYTPGHRGPKLFMIAFGLTLLACGVIELKEPLSLVIAGTRTAAEATRIIKTKAGLPDQILVDDVRVSAAKESRDRSYIFWNEFRFTAADSTVHVVRLPIGSQLKPLYRLLDDDGLPTSVELYYDPNDPDKTCVPGVMSTWFAPGMITFMGLISALFGSILLYWSNRRIEIS